MTTTTVQLYNLSGPLCTVDVDPNWTVVDLKRTLAKIVRVPPRQQRLLCGVSQLRDSDVLAEVLLEGHVTFARVIASEEAEQWIAKVRNNSNALCSAPDHIKKDHEVVLAAMHNNLSAVQYAVADVLKDRDFASAVVAWAGSALFYLDSQFKADEEIVLTAVRQNAYAITYASNDLQTNRVFMFEAIRCSSGLVLKHASSEMQHDRELALSAVRLNWLLMSCLPGHDDREIVFAAVSNHGCALEFAAEFLCADREIVEMALLRSHGSALKWASAELRGDKSLVLSAVKEDATVLQWASEELRADRDVVLEAVRRNGNLLKYASVDLRADRLVVQTAVQQAGGCVLRYVKKDLADELAPELEELDLFAS